MRSPVGSSYYIEGLRLALGILGADDEHDVSIAHVGKGVRCALKDVDRSYANDFIEIFGSDKDGKKFYVEQESLEAEGLLESELDDNFAVVSRDYLAEKLLQADFALSF